MFSASGPSASPSVLISRLATCCPSILGLSGADARDAEQVDAFDRPYSSRQTKAAATWRTRGIASREILPHSGHTHQPRVAIVDMGEIVKRPVVVASTTRTPWSSADDIPDAVLPSPGRRRGRRQPLHATESRSCSRSDGALRRGTRLFSLARPSHTEVARSPIPPLKPRRDVATARAGFLPASRAPCEAAHD